MHILTDADRLAIREFAAGDGTKSVKARRAFFRAAPLNDIGSCVELQFMNEVLAPIPDPIRQAKYRKAVLAQALPETVMAMILTDAERRAIHGLAAGDGNEAAAARAAFDRAAPLHGVDSCVELQFMCECLAPVPDLLLRAKYRKEVLAQAVPAATR